MKKRVLDKDHYIFLDKPPVSLYNEEDHEERKAEIDAYTTSLRTYMISLESLSKEHFSREELSLHLNLALILLSEEKLWTRTKELKRIPLKVFSSMVEEPLFELKKRQKHILALTLLLEPGIYPKLQKTLHFGPAEEKRTTLIEGKDHTGTVLKRRGGVAYILTNDGAFYKIRDTGSEVGTLGYGKKVRRKPNVLKPLLVLLVLAIPLGFYYNSLQKEIERTVIIKAVGEVTLKFNSFGHLVDAFGNNPKGRDYIERARFDDLSLDAAVGEVLEQAYISETIREKSTVEILISGKPLAKDYFHEGETKDRIVSYQIEAKINDNGSFLYTQ
ncbi:hypothetical protein [Proteiniclasticum ruminis]|uniref:RsgI N-terminal anti-sigma domain-containing protein n=1 Tax=Proteiniclasticum ruminis TaxID=398199 RepID=A0A1I5BCK3_9CLOT|nr:hypothetical protein [Proteiniclasticum ruminis]SFN72435.1 hypothetical protein SAMN04488695_104138 [Proteiniclasticum ruminis]